MKTFTIFDQSTKKIIKTVTCTEEAINLQLEEGQGFLEGDQPYGTHKVSDDGTMFIEYSDTEKEEILYQQRMRTLPFLDVSMPDTDLNATIEAYYLGRVSAIDWRIENYGYLRQLAYPSYKDTYLDAMVKLSSQDPNIQTEGALQLQQYYADCLAVKERFPKE